MCVKINGEGRWPAQIEVARQDDHAAGNWSVTKRRKRSERECERSCGAAVEPLEESEDMSCKPLYLNNLVRGRDSICNLSWNQTCPESISEVSMGGPEVVSANFAGHLFAEIIGASCGFLRTVKAKVGPRKTRLFGSLAAILLFAASAAFADTIGGSAGAGWQNFPTLTENGPTYWDNHSFDGSQANVGYLMTNTGAFSGSTLGPGALPYWEMRTGARI